MDGETDGEMGGALGIFWGASCFSHPLLPPSEIGKACLETPRLRLRLSRVGAAADRREVGASCSGVLPSPRRGPDRWAARKAWCCSPPFSGGAQRLFSPALSPPYSLSLPPGMEPCAAWSPHGGRGTATLPFRGVQQSHWGCGDGGEREGAHPRGGGKGLPPGAILGPGSLGTAAAPAVEPLGWFSAALHSP